MNHPVASAGQQGCDDHAHADEHINENDGGAAVDVHGGRNPPPAGASSSDAVKL